mmetsp:Transcript_38567/g.38924  ORF Transcript_38567/g.38924 Transcript_38567/m.38924 type:complete len:259 (-) Transcript_38567:374-1150(-)
MVLTTTDKIDDFFRKHILTDYPKSHIFTVGYELYSGCVACMYLYMCLKRSTIHLVLPWLLEAAIRGHIGCMLLLIEQCYGKSEPLRARALQSFWAKTMNEVDDTVNYEERRKEIKKKHLNMCANCGKKDTEDRTFEKCGKCKAYSYCSKGCQRKQWNDKHMNECRQVMILKEYYKPRYAREIREAIIRGDDSKNIDRLQTLRTQLGLTRPKEEYEELLLIRSSNTSESGDNNRTNNPYEYLVARRDGTVHIGSTSNVI